MFKIISNFNDLDKLRIYNLVSQKGGGKFNMNILKIIFGLLLIVVGVIFLLLPNYYSEVNATVSKITNDSLYKYVTLTYTVNNVSYTKQVTYKKSSLIQENTIIKIYYDNNDPNLINLDTNTYYIMSAIFVLFGLYLIFVDSSHNIKRNIFSDTSLYQTDSNLDNIKII